MKIKNKFHGNYTETPAEILEENAEIFKKFQGNSAGIPGNSAGNFAENSPEISRKCFHGFLSHGI